VRIPNEREAHLKLNTVYRILHTVFGTWCSAGDSNSHGSPHRLLRPACLPIPPAERRKVGNDLIVPLLAEFKSSKSERSHYCRCHKEVVLFIGESHRAATSNFLATLLLEFQRNNDLQYKTWVGFPSVFLSWRVCETRPTTKEKLLLYEYA
jgi:hypothetical protein